MVLITTLPGPNGFLAWWGGELHWCCPGCGRWQPIEEDALHGRKGQICGEDCAFVEIRDWHRTATYITFRNGPQP